MGAAAGGNGASVEHRVRDVPVTRPRSRHSVPIPRTHPSGQPPTMDRVRSKVRIGNRKCLFPDTTAAHISPNERIGAELAGQTAGAGAGAKLAAAA